MGFSNFEKLSQHLSSSNQNETKKPKTNYDNEEDHKDDLTKFYNNVFKNVQNSIIPKDESTPFKGTINIQSLKYYLNNYPISNDAKNLLKMIIKEYDNSKSKLISLYLSDITNNHLNQLVELYRLTNINSLINILLDMFNLNGDSIYQNSLKKLHIDISPQYNLFIFFISKLVNVRRFHLYGNNDITETLVKSDKHNHRTVKVSNYVNYYLEKFSKSARCSLASVISALVETTYTIELFNGNIATNNSDEKIWYNTVCEIPKIDANVNIDQLKEFANKVKNIEKVNN